jgi:ABC-type polysaccharide/polyol phosphate export permease
MSPTPSAGPVEPDPASGAGEILDTGSHVVGGWVTASPPKAIEVVQRVLGFPKLLVTHRDLVTTSVNRELRARFTGTVLGLLWPLVHPLFMFAVYYFIFTKLLQFKMPDLPKEHESAMGVFMFVGILIWAAFADAISRGCSVIVDNGNLIKKVAFPSETLPLNVVLVAVVTMMFGVVAFLVAAFLTPIWPAPDPVVLLWIPVLLLIQIAFSYGLALILSTLYVFLRDTLQLVTILVTVWMFLTPIFWVPELIGGIEPYMPLIEANPMYHLVYAWRVVLMGGEPAMAFTGDFLPSVGTAAVWAVAAYLVGYTFFTLARRRFADEV